MGSVGVGKVGVEGSGATGALSGPHDRYQARIAWLVVLPPAFAAMRSRYAASLATSSGVMRTRAS